MAFCVLRFASVRGGVLNYIDLLHYILLFQIFSTVSLPELSGFTR